MANPFMVMAGVIAGVAFAGFGVLSVPGWVASAKDAAVIDELANIREAQAVYFDVHGSYAENLDDLNREGSWSTRVDIPAGMSPDESIGFGKAWCAVLQSSSGNFLGQASNRWETVVGGSYEEVHDEVCDEVVNVELEDPSEPVLSVGLSGNQFIISETGAACGAGTAMFRFRSSWTTTEVDGEWSEWGEWDDLRTAVFETSAPGARYSFQVEVKCVNGSKESAVVSAGVLDHYTTIPAAGIGTLTASSTASAWTAKVEAPGANCEAGLPEYRFRTRFSQTATMSAWSSWSDWAADDSVTVNSPEPGAKYESEAQARCVTDVVTGEAGPSKAASSVVAIAAPATPSITTALSSGTATSTITGTCPEGTTTAYEQQRRQSKSDVITSWSSSQTAQSYAATMKEGYKLDAQGRIKCTTNWASSSWSSWKVSNAVIRPITTTPTFTSITYGLDATSQKGWIKGTVAGCPTDTYVKGRLRRTWDEGAVKYAGYKDLTNGVAYQWDSVEYTPQGTKYVLGTEIYCWTQHSNGPVKTTDAAAKIRPIDAPDSPALTTSTGTGTVKGTIPAVSCPDSTTAQYHWRHRFTTNTDSWPDPDEWGPWGTSKSYTISNTKTGTYSIQVQARCVSAFAQSSTAGATKQQKYP